MPAHIITLDDRTVTLDATRRHATIELSNGKVVTFFTAREAGFNESNIEMLSTHDFSRPSLKHGETRRARRITVLGRIVYVHVNTGPPTWWFPKVEVENGHKTVMVGWIRGLIAVSYRGKEALDV